MRPDVRNRSLLWVALANSTNNVGPAVSLLQENSSWFPRNRQPALNFVDDDEANDDVHGIDNVRRDITVGALAGNRMLSIKGPRHPCWQFDNSYLKGPQVWICCVMLFFAGMLCSAGGIGGGGVFVTVLMVAGGLEITEAVPLSKAIVFLGSISSLCLNLTKSLPKSRATLMDYNIVRLVVPAGLGGTFIGVLLNHVLPGWLITLVLALLLVSISILVCRTAYSQFREEQQDASIERLHRESRAQVEAHHQRMSRSPAQTPQEPLSPATPQRAWEQPAAAWLQPPEEPQPPEAAAAAPPQEQPGPARQDEADVPKIHIQAIAEPPAEAAAAAAGAEGAASGLGRRKVSTAKGLTRLRPRASSMPMNAQILAELEAAGMDTKDMAEAALDKSFRRYTWHAGPFPELSFGARQLAGRNEVSPNDLIILLIVLLVVVICSVFRYHAASCRNAPVPDRDLRCNHPFLFWLGKGTMEHWMTTTALATSINAFAFAFPLLVCFVVSLYYSLCLIVRHGWQVRECIAYDVMALLAGILAGLVGVGGGLVFAPFFLFMNFEPAVAVATSSTCVTFTASSTTLQYLFSDRIIMSLSVVYGFVTLAASYTGTKCVHLLQDRFSAKRSYISAIVGAGVVLSTVLSILELVR